MPGTKADIIARLEKEILPLQGFKTASHNNMVDAGLGKIKYAFPNHTFPLGAIHEFISKCPEDSAASSGFVAGIVSSLMQKKGASVWISPYLNIFPRPSVYLV